MWVRMNTNEIVDDVQPTTVYCTDCGATEYTKEGSYEDNDKPEPQ